MVVGGVSLLLAPRAWLDYPTVLRNLLAGSGDVYYNLAPATVLARSDLPDELSQVARLAALTLGVASLFLSAWLARREGGMPAAALFGTVAMLVVPATIWYHYLVVLLPLAAMAWPKAGPIARTLLLLSCAAITFAGVRIPPLDLIGTAVLLSVAAWILWPLRDGVVRYAATSTQPAD